MLAFSHDSPTVNVNSYVKTIPPNHSLVVFVGAMAHGSDDFADDKIVDKISISDYPLSASIACGKLCFALEDSWGIL